MTTQYVNEAESCDMVALISGGRLIALAEPENLRREAMGGDVVEIQTTNQFDPAGLPRRADVIRTIERQGPNSLRIRVDDAATAMPEVVEAITQRGGEVPRPTRHDRRSMRCSPSSSSATVSPAGRRRARLPDAGHLRGRSSGCMAFVGKEIIETLRRPGAILSLVLGPFLIMAVFGLGYSGVKRPLETVIVAPAIERPARRRRDLPGAGRAVASTSPRSPQDRAAAERRLHAGTATSSWSPPTIPKRSSGPASSR